MNEALIIEEEGYEFVEFDDDEPVAKCGGESSAVGSSCAEDPLLDADSSRTPDLYFERSFEDEHEENIIEGMYGVDAPVCCISQCNKKILKGMAIDYRRDFIALEKAEQDILLLGHISASKEDASLFPAYDEQQKFQKSSVRSQEKSRKSVMYFFRGLVICRSFYFFLHAISNKRYKNLTSHYLKQGLCQRKHGLTGKINRKNFISEAEAVKVKNFIVNYAKKVAIPLPGRLPSHKNYKLMKLPSSDNKTVVYAKYVEACLPGEKIIGLRSFQDLWARYCPFVVTMKPSTDLCDKCRQLMQNTANVANKSEDEKKKAANDLLNHLEDARKQREYYNACIEKAEKTEEAEFLVISMDYAQNVSYPSSPQQVGSSYFKSGRKCAIFGIANERTKVQDNYLVDESYSIGKGPNSVISMLDDYLERHPSKKVIIFADNCVSQNKNNALVRYLQWRVDCGKNDTISVNFLLTGHTKFTPDRHFGVLKSKYAVAIIDCFGDVVKCVNESSRAGFNVAVPVTSHSFKWKDFNTFFGKYYKVLKMITLYHHFIFSKKAPVGCKLLADSDPEEFALQLTELNPTDTVPSIVPPGLSLERQWYFFTDLRDLCMDAKKKDECAPKPARSLPTKRKGKVDDSAESPTKKIPKSSQDFLKKTVKKMAIPEEQLKKKENPKKCQPRKLKLDKAKKKEDPKKRQPRKSISDKAEKKEDPEKRRTRKSKLDKAVKKEDPKKSKSSPMMKRTKKPSLRREER